MPGRDRGDAWKGANEAWDVVGLLLSGILVCGGLGWLLDLAFDYHYLFLPVGMVLGVGISIWLVYLKHGKPE
jgi:ATP synthase protein I